MDIFRTQFMMSGVNTDAVVIALGNKAFGVVLDLVDSYEGEEYPVDMNSLDFTMRLNDEGKWETLGDPKIHLNESDLTSLGRAIAETYPEGLS